MKANATHSFLSCAFGLGLLSLSALEASGCGIRNGPLLSHRVPLEVVPCSTKITALTRQWANSALQLLLDGAVFVPLPDPLWSGEPDDV